MITAENAGSSTSTTDLFDETSLELKKAKDDLNSLLVQSGYNPDAEELELQIAQDKVKNLNSRLNDLTEELSNSVGTSAPILTDYLVTGSPTAPTVVLPERTRARNVLMAGALFGAIIAWAALNYKWLMAQLSALFGSKRAEGD